MNVILRKFNMLYVLVLCGFSLMGFSVSANENVKKKPNIVFILADDLGAHTLSMDGNPLLETPNIDQLSKDGMHFTKGYANYPTCKPSRAALMSGQYGPRTSIYRVAERHKGQEDKIKFKVPVDARVLSLETKTIGEALKQQGYRTAMLGKWHLGTKDSAADKQGFDLAIESHGAHFGATTTPKIDIPKGQYIGDVLTDKAIEFIGKAHLDNRPFFLYVPYFLIHKPLEAKAKDLAYFDKKVGDKYDKDSKTVAAMTKILDDNVGRIIAKLDQLNLSKDTLVVFTSDNGGYPLKNNLLNGKLRGKKGDMYEGGIRVPYIFKWPGVIAAQSQSDEPIIGVDLYPTFMSVASANKDQNTVLDGVDFLPILKGDINTVSARDLFWFYPKWAGFNKKSHVWKDNWRNTILSGDYKLIEYLDTDKYELFNLKDDPYEKKNLSKKMSEKLIQLKDKLTDWKKHVNAPMPIENPDYLYKNKASN